MSKESAEQIVQLDPSKVLADDNARYALLPHKVENMAASIIARGGVMQPVEVEPLPKDSKRNGYTHRLTAGFYRHAGVLKLNTESAAGLTLPAIVRQPADGTDRLMRQISENRDRENMSPMDEAVAIKKLMDAGVSRKDIMAAFARPGGRKGLAMQPASNAHINMMLSFLDLPKSVQAKIHDGRLGVAAAYELTKVPKEQQAEILEKAEAARQKAIDREEREDERLAKAEEREAKAGEREAEKAAKVKEAEDKLTAAASTLAETKAHLEKAQAAKAEIKTPENFLELPDADKKAFAERLNAAKADIRAAEKLVAKAVKEHANAQRVVNLLTKPAETPAPAAETKPAAPAKGNKKAAAPSQADVRKAAKESGVETSKPVTLNATEARNAAADLAKSRFPKVKAIGQVLVKLLAGELTPKSAETDLSVITGERSTKKA